MDNVELDMVGESVTKRFNQGQSRVLTSLLLENLQFAAGRSKSLIEAELNSEQIEFALWVFFHFHTAARVLACESISPDEIAEAYDQFTFYEKDPLPDLTINYLRTVFETSHYRVERGENGSFQLAKKQPQLLLGLNGLQIAKAAAYALQGLTWASLAFLDEE